MCKIKVLALVILFTILGTFNTIAGLPLFPANESDNDDVHSLFAFFDLRDRESFLQLTKTGSSAVNLHIQIFNVGNLCNENDFFDGYTGNDTHVYNMRDILTNDGNPSGVALPGDAYGIVAISSLNSEGSIISGPLMGNIRILDINGYEYRTNLETRPSDDDTLFPDDNVYTFNFNQEGGVSLSDIVGIYMIQDFTGQVEEWNPTNFTNTFVVMDVDIFDNNEVPLSCRDIIFSCIEPENPLVDDLFAVNSDGPGVIFDGTNGASVASFEYGINNTIPHSKGSELLCPGNVIGEGIVRLQVQGVAYPPVQTRFFLTAYVGLNNGNGRGSMDAFWSTFPMSQLCPT